MEIFEKDVAAPPPAAPAPFHIPTGPINRHLVFTGDGGEYFKIWAVNLGLTIITLGIYSAWAKVRRLRYFYGNTLFANSSFEFHGSPVAILRGRIVALVLLLLFTQSHRVSLYLYGVVLVALVAVFPWLYWRSLRFRLGNTSWRGVRFGFSGSLAEAYRCVAPPAVFFVALNAVGVAATVLGPAHQREIFITLGALYLVLLALAPLFYHRIRAYQHNHSRIGNTYFAYDGRLAQMYAIAAWIALIGLSIGLPATGMIWWSVQHKADSRFAALALCGVMLLFVGYVLLLVAIPWSSARAQNVVWNGTVLNGIRIQSRLRPWGLVGVELLNFFLNAWTVGLFRPFAVMRTLKLRLPAITYSGDPESFLAAASATSGATGSEVAEIFGFDIAL